MIDLHTHSNLSDGTLSPNDLILYAKRRGIDTLAISDHETISNFKKYSKFAEKNGVKMIPAVEINAGDFKNFHLVAYGVQDLETLENIFNKIKIENVKVCSKVLERLKTDYGIELSESEVLKFSASGILDKRAIAKALIDKGFAPDTKSVYDNYIGQGAKSYVPIKKLFAKDIIKTVHELGGIVVWAHYWKTNQQNNKTKTDQKFIHNNQTIWKQCACKELIFASHISCTKRWWVVCYCTNWLWQKQS